MTTSATDHCPCGKPRAHLDADPDSQDWACRVPVATDEGDLHRPFRSLDPYMDACPPWCEAVADGHPIVSSDTDRVHYGTERYVPVRTLRADYLACGHESVLALGHVATGVRRRPREAQPSVALRVRSADLNIDGCSHLEVELTVDEAEAVRDALAASIAQVRGS